MSNGFHFMVLYVAVWCCMERLGPGGTTIKGAPVKGVSKRVKHSCLGFNCAQVCASRLTYQCARNFLDSVALGVVLRWPAHGGLPQRSGAAVAYITEGHCYLIG